MEDGEPPRTDLFQLVIGSLHMVVSKNRGTPNWMENSWNGKPLLKFMIWGYPYFWKHPHINKPSKIDYLEGSKSTAQPEGTTRITNGY